MATVIVDDSSLEVESRPKSVSLVWELTPFYNHQVDRVNTMQNFTRITAPQTRSYIILSKVKKIN